MEYVNKYLILTLLLLLTVGCTHPFEAADDNTPLGNFEALWRIIDEKYCFLDEKGINWDSVHDVYRPRFDTMRITNWDDNYLYFNQMAEVVNLLRDGHVNLYSFFDISSCTDWYTGYPSNFDADLLTRVYLTDYHRAGGISYQRIHGDTIGYIYYGSFSSGFSDANLIAVLNHFRDCRGIVLDVRNNGGGDLNNAYKLAAPFFSRDTVVGYWQHKSGKAHDDFSEMQPMRLEDAKGYWLRPVIVLCNRHSYSAANFFVSIMRYADNSLILGGLSGGGGGMPLSYELPNGWLLRFSSVRMYDLDNQSIEPGIQPDGNITLTSTDRDDIIETAVRIINYAYDKN